MCELFHLGLGVTGFSLLAYFSLASVIGRSIQ